MMNKAKEGSRGNARCSERKLTTGKQVSTDPLPILHFLCILILIKHVSIKIWFLIDAGIKDVQIILTHFVCLQFLMVFISK